MTALVPLIDRIGKDVLSADLLHADDTPVRVGPVGEFAAGLKRLHVALGRGDPSCVVSRAGYRGAPAGLRGRIRWEGPPGRKNLPPHPSESYRGAQV